MAVIAAVHKTAAVPKENNEKKADAPFTADFELFLSSSLLYFHYLRFSIWFLMF